SVSVVFVGNPRCVVTEKLPAEPTENVVWSALVIDGSSVTVSVKLWVAFGGMPLLAVIVIGYDPPVPAAGVPARVAVPSPLSVKLTPDGRLPVSVIVVAVGAVVTVNVPAEPTAKVVWSALVISAEAVTVRVNAWSTWP